MQILKDKARITFYEGKKFKKWAKVKNLKFSEITKFLEEKSENKIKFYWEFINNENNLVTEWHILDAITFYREEYNIWKLCKEDKKYVLTYE